MIVRRSPVISPSTFDTTPSHCSSLSMAPTRLALKSYSVSTPPIKPFDPTLRSVLSPSISSRSRCVTPSSTSEIFNMSRFCLATNSSSWKFSLSPGGAGFLSQSCTVDVSEMIDWSPASDMKEYSSNPECSPVPEMEDRSPASLGSAIACRPCPNSA